MSTDPENIIRYEDWHANWKRIAREGSGDIPVDFEIQVYKKLLDIFHVGDYYFYIFNVANVEIEFVSDQLGSVLGIEKEQFTPRFVFDIMHPSDRQRFLDNERYVTDFFTKLQPEKVFSYKVSYDYRLKDKDGKYRWIHQQVITIQSAAEGAVVRTLGVHTDITHIKMSQQPMLLTFTGMDGEAGFSVPCDQNFRQMIFSDREKEIIALIYAGLSSEQIAEKLFISIHTVNSHRKRILKKTSCTGWNEFLAKAVENGWF